MRFFRPLILLATLLVAALVSTPARGLAPGASPLSTVPDWSAEGNQADALFGSRVGSAGDVNGDGFDDVVVGAFRFDNPDIDEGMSWLYLGSATGLGLSPVWSVEGDQPNAQLTGGVFAGDVNGDGFDDIAVGAGLYDGDLVDEGRVLLFLGSASGPSPTPDWVVEGDQAGAVFGNVAAAGDVNGDGYDDLLVGAAGYDNGEMDEGRAYLFLGSATGLSTTPDWITEGNQVSALYSRVAGIGDVNGDGFDDVAVGSQWYDGGSLNEGRVFLFKGSVNGLRAKPFRVLEINEENAVFGNQVAGAGDLNNDGYDDVIVSALGVNNPTFVQRVFVFMGSRQGTRPVPAVVLQSDQPTNAHFGISINRAGDVNGDGFSDIIVGARLYDVTLTNQGRAFVYAGSASGLIATPLQTFDGEQAAEEFAVNVNGAGDVNGDGFGDIIIGAHAWDNPENNEGRAVVFHGGP